MSSKFPSIVIQLRPHPDGYAVYVYWFDRRGSEGKWLRRSVHETKSDANHHVRYLMHEYFTGHGEKAETVVVEDATLKKKRTIHRSNYRW